MNGTYIQRELMAWVMSSNSEIVVPNYYLGRYECDVLKISGAGQLYEYEIKVTKADFKKDFEKHTYGKFLGYEEPVKNAYGGIYRKPIFEKVSKHQDVISGKRCSRFYFVVPEGLIQPNEVPFGLGLIYASLVPSMIHKDKLHFQIVKVSKHFKKEPATIQFYKHIAQNLTLKLISAKRRAKIKI